jgi:hypothetical protein
MLILLKSDTAGDDGSCMKQTTSRIDPHPERLLDGPSGAAVTRAARVYALREQVRTSRYHPAPEEVAEYLLAWLE